MDLEKELKKVIKPLDETPLTFGKYKGMTPNEIAEEDEDYLVWAYETLDIKPCSKALYLACYEDSGDGDVEDLVDKFNSLFGE